MNSRLLVLLAAEETYLKEAGWVLASQSITLRRSTVWRSPHDGDEYAQSSAILRQKVEDGYLPRPAHQQPLSTL